MNRQRTGSTPVGVLGERRDNDLFDTASRVRTRARARAHARVEFIEKNGDAENGEGRVLIPFKIYGIQQVFHVDPQVVTAPAATSGPRTGLGDAQIYNLTLTKQDIGLPEKVTFGIGPLIAVPTNTSTNFGPNSLQGGVAGGGVWGRQGDLITSRLSRAISSCSGFS